MASKEPTYDCDPYYGCDCIDGLVSGELEIEPEWEWNEEQEYWECVGCGGIQ